MSVFVTPAIPAAQLVNVVPSVLSAGGNGLDLIGLILTQNDAIPVGEVLQFADATDVGATFGPTSNLAGLATVYFNGPNNATRLPGSLLIARYPEQATAGYLMSGSLASTTLAALQAVNSTLNLTIDGTPVSHTLNLTTATSFSNAALLIASAFSIKGVQKATVTAALSGTTLTVDAVVNGPAQCEFTASLSGTVMTVTAVAGGSLAIGQVVIGTGITAGTTISSFGSGLGGTGTYNLSSAATTEAAESIVAYNPVANLQIGDVITGTGISGFTYISALGTGTGGIGTYTVSAAMTTESDETVAVFAAAVTYNAVQQKFIIASGTTGVNSSVSFGTGAAATPLLLTQALGAVQSPGAAAATPGAFMPTITAITQNWAEFMTDWEPVEPDKEAFEDWVNGTRNRYAYIMWDTNVLNTGANGPSAAVGHLTATQSSGTVPVYQNPAITTLGGEKAAFVMGFIASLDFSRFNGRATAAYKWQSGLATDITNGTQAINLCGDPASDSFGYGVNFGGDYTTANQAFFGLQRGVISGTFKWLDSYVNQIWLSNALQVAIMNGLFNVNSLPYNQDGYNQLASWCLDPIQAALNFGAIRVGVPLSNAQAAAVNAAAGVQIDQILTQQGYYLQVKPATSQARVGRTSPPATLWYCDGGSIQNVNLASIQIQ